MPLAPRSTVAEGHFREEHECARALPARLWSLGRRRFQNRKVPSRTGSTSEPHPGGNVRRHLRTTLAVLLTVIGFAVVGPTSAASAQTSGPESFTGFLIATGVSG